jgi:monofunctional biosynthetic peptidoglycan transglycosylase
MDNTLSQEKPPPSFVRRWIKIIGKILMWFIIITWKHTNISYNDAAPAFYKAIVAAEDQRFYQHSGFDWVELEKARQAAERNPRKPMRGASTITQQTAKNLFLPPVRNIIRKGFEAYYTVLIELLWSKQRILEMYGNIVELAPGIYGVEEGARYHFHKSAKQLSRREAALLASVLINPQRWSASKPSGFINRRADRILRQMDGIPVDTEEEPDE